MYVREKELKKERKGERERKADAKRGKDSKSGRVRGNQKESGRETEKERREEGAEVIFFHQHFESFENRLSLCPAGCWAVRHQIHNL